MGKRNAHFSKRHHDLIKRLLRGTHQVTWQEKEKRRYAISTHYWIKYAENSSCLFLVQGCHAADMFISFPNTSTSTQYFGRRGEAVNKRVWSLIYSYFEPFSWAKLSLHLYSHIYSLIHFNISISAVTLLAEVFLYAC